MVRYCITDPYTLCQFQQLGKTIADTFAQRHDISLQNTICKLKWNDQSLWYSEPHTIAIGERNSHPHPLMRKK